MFIFALKKIFARIFFPLPLVTILMLTGLILIFVSRKHKWKYGKIYCTILFMISLGILIAGSLFGELMFIACAKDEKPLKYSEIPQSQVVICVTGFGYTPNIEGFPVETKLLGETKNRLNEGCRIASMCMKSGRDWKLVVSIAGEAKYMEAKKETVLAYGAMFGLPHQKIEFISNAKNTKDEIREFSNYNGKLIVVSHPLHLSRIRMLAKQNKISIITSASDVCGKYKFEPWKIMPSAANFYLFELIVYEWLGRLEISILQCEKKGYCFTQSP